MPLENLAITFAGQWPDIAYLRAARAYDGEPDNRMKKATEFKKCAQCAATFYCDSKCQKAHWASHNLVCLPQQSLHAVTMKLFERMIATPHLWIYFDVISIVTLDLLNKPENAACHCLYISCIFVPSGKVDSSGRPEGIFQISDNTPKHLKDVPDGEEAFSSELQRYNYGFLSHNLYFIDGNPFFGGYSGRTMQITRHLQPRLLQIVRNWRDKNLFPIKCFGLLQIIPLEKNALVQCINDAICGERPAALS